jgi:hypothetical protein
MFFIVRMVFWLAVVLALLPSDRSKSGAAAPSVMAACGQAATRTLHDFLHPEPRQTRPTSAVAAAPSPAANPSRSTLTAADLAPAWHGPRSNLRKKHGA